MTLKAILGTGAIAGLALGASAALADHHEEAAEDEGYHALSSILGGVAHYPEGSGGDAHGEGQFVASFSADDTEMCYVLLVETISAPSAAHIHAGASGASGPPVVPLAAPVVGESTRVCTEIEPDMAAALKASPGDYYVNVHNADFPGGAQRGQLMGGG